MPVRMDVDAAEMVRLHEEEKWSARKIARKFGVSPRCVGKRLKEAGCKARSKAEDLLGLEFGNLKVVRPAGMNNFGTRKWLYECKCGNEIEVISSNLKNGTVWRCRDCSGVCEPTNLPTGCNIPKWYWHRLEGAASDRDLEFSIDPMWASDLLDEQDWRCALTGWPLSFSEKMHHKGTTASLDRIDNSVGYVVGNVQWLHKDVNWLKSSFSQEELLHLCRSITDYSRNKDN
jgi:hypothetical protein